MAKSGDYDLGDFYQPGYNSFKPGDGAPNYLGKKNLISAGEMGMTTNPMVADQLSELSKHLNTGASTIELGSMNMKIFDSIPKQHFDELRRKGKLSEAKLSFHAPIQDMDPSGFGEQGWQESKQKLVERQLKEVIDKAAMIDKKGNIPVTIHGSVSSGSTFKYEGGKKKYDTLFVVDKQTGQVKPIQESFQYQPGMQEWSKEEARMDPIRALKSTNSTTWRKDIDEVLFEKENADRIISDVYPLVKNVYSSIKSNPEKSGELFNSLTPDQRELILKMQTADAHLHQAELNVTGVFDKAYQYGENKKELKNLAENYDRSLNGGYTTQDYYNILEKAQSGNLTKKDEEKLMKIQSARLDLQNQSFAIQNFAEKLRKYNPQMLTTIENFAIEKASETFSNVALHSYDKYGQGAPTVSIENLYQGTGFSQGEDLKNLIEKSQEKFIEKAVKKGKSKSEAEKMAKKLIGATFDVGHLNMSRAYGFSEENLVKEAEAIKKHVKHVHLTDNFGNADVHLPIGMGNVPVQALLEALGDEGERARKINEVGGWFEHFKTNPFPELLGGAGSQVYSTGDGPMWAQSPGFQQSYVEGYGQMLPDINYQTFGAGFSQLPSSLGGQRQQSGGRMGGGF
jgi:hypothetical protein